MIGNNTKDLITWMLLFLCLTVLTFSKRDYSPTRTVSNTTFALNTVYQPSTSRDAMIVCGTTIESNLTLSGGQSGTILVQTSPDNVTYTTIGKMQNDNSGAVSVGLNNDNIQSSGITFFLLHGGYFKLVSSGGSTMSAIAGQQCLF